MVSKYRSTIHPKCDVLPDGTEVRLVPVERTNNHYLYASKDGRVFSLHGQSFYPLRPTITNYPCNRANGRRKQHYLKMNRRYGYILVHTAVALAWIGPASEGLERSGSKPVIDHLNGITADNRVDNLQWVTPEENCKRAKILRILRSLGRDPRKMTRDELLSIFKHYTFQTPHDRMEFDMTHHCEC